MENYEEKYENLIEKLKKAKEEHGGYTFSSVIDKIIPELCESEDDRIRKAILHLVKSQKEQHFGIPTYDGINWLDMIAWLEKQGEKKPVSTEETELNSIAFLTGLGYTCIPPMKENQMMDLWEYIKEFKDKFGRLPKDEDELAVCIDYVMKRKKSVWSEEDEKKRQLLIKVLEVNHPNANFKVNPINTTNMEAMSSKELVGWLKSIKPCWKPTEEQISELGKAAILQNVRFNKPILESLYNDLKSL